MANEFKAEMEVYFCEDCGYSNVPCEVDRDVFFQDYYYLSSINSELSSHFERFADEVASSGYEFVIDVGSNDGILLRPLKARGINCLGVDPSENVSRIANDSGLETIVDFFDHRVATKIIREYGRPDLVTASSVFTHLENPSKFFADVKSLIQPTGKLVIEVEYLGRIIEDYAFERFYFDRPHYYSLRSMAKLGAMHGFQVEDARIIDVHGGSLRVTFALGDSISSSAKFREIYDSEADILSSTNIEQKFSDFHVACGEMKKSIFELQKKGFTVAGYGCPARFSTITNYCGLTADYLLNVVDDSPLKQGRFSPGMHIPIVDYNSDNNPDVYLVFAFEYIASIKKKVGPLARGYFKPVPFVEI
jgi:hypothetical protein